MPLGLVPKIPEFVDVVAGFNKALRMASADVQLSHKLGLKGIPPRFNQHRIRSTFQEMSA